MLITPINDRTREDVNFAKKNQSLTTDNKGVLNYNDLNRIENNYNYIVELLRAKGYYIYGEPYEKGNWTEDDVPWLDEVDRLRQNYTLINKGVLDEFFYKLNIGLDQFDYIECNHIEDLVLKIIDLLPKMEKDYIYCGEIDCGGNI